MEFQELVVDQGCENVGSITPNKYSVKDKDNVFPPVKQRTAKINKKQRKIQEGQGTAKLGHRNRGEGEEM